MNLLNNAHQIVRERLIGLPRVFKRLLVVTVDACLCCITAWFAFYLRLGEFVSFSGALAVTASISVLIAIPIFSVSGLYRALFRFSGKAVILLAATSVAAYGVLFFSVISVIGIEGVPRTLGVIQPLLLVVAITTSRLITASFLDGTVPVVRDSRGHRAVALIYGAGAGAAGRQLADALGKSRELRVIGYVDDDDRLHGQTINTLRVFSRSDIDTLIKDGGVDQILLAIPSATRFQNNQLLTALSMHGISIRTLPTLADIAEGKVTLSDIRELDVADLLGREEVPPNPILLSAKVADRTVLVTGAGGSIGSELCRQIFGLGPEKLPLLDVNEYALYTINEAIGNLKKTKRDIRMCQLSLYYVL